MTTRWQLRKRQRLVAGLLTPGCAECPAKAGEWCDPDWPPPAEMCRIDKDPPHVIHSTRIAAAVKGGRVDRNLLIAQFAGGPLPPGLTRR